MILCIQVVRIVTYLVMYGFLGSKEDMDYFMPHIIDFIDGRNDLPFPPDSGASMYMIDMNVISGMIYHSFIDSGSILHILDIIDR